MPEPKRSLKVFLSYASQDKPVVRELSGRLASEGWIDPWFDEKKLLPGQDWRTKIEEAVESSDVVIICLSSNSVTKEGFVQKELRYAREIAFEKPDETIFLIPLRLDDCSVPRGLRFYQWADYFGKKKGETYSALLNSLQLRHEQKLKIEDEAARREKAEPEVAENAEREEAEQDKLERDAAKKTDLRKTEYESIKYEVVKEKPKTQNSIDKPNMQIVFRIIGIITTLFLLGLWFLKPNFTLKEATPTPPATEQLIVVYVTGAVLRPGAYEFPQDVRVIEAIKAAGDFLVDADRSYLNLAAKLQDGQILNVPFVTGMTTITPTATSMLKVTPTNTLIFMPPMGTPIPKIVDFLQYNEDAIVGTFILLGMALVLYIPARALKATRFLKALHLGTIGITGILIVLVLIIFWIILKFSSLLG